MNNDAIRDKLLRYFYDRHKSALSVNRQQIGIQDLQRAMKSSDGFSQSQVASNLTYLIEQGFVKQLVTPRTFQTPYGTTQSAEKVTYRIAKAGIDRLEGDSDFQRASPFSGINITNISGVVAVGDGNTQRLVQRRFEPLLHQLELLQRAIQASDMPEERKLNATLDVQTLENELAKPAVNRSIVREAWSGVEKVVTAGKAAELVVKVGQLIAPMLSGPTIPQF